MWLKILLVLFLLALLYVLHQCSVWQIWRCKECNIPRCSEAVYTFPGSTWTKVYHDQLVLDSCDVKNPAKWQGISYKFQTSDETPDIITKCGKVKPKLLSFRLKVEQKLLTKVPNIVHFVSYGSYAFKFLHYLSFLSTHRYIKPRFIYLHGNVLPKGYWWQQILKDVANLYHVSREKTVRIQGYKVPFIEHCSDLIRLQTLRDNGGIYMDTDIMALRDFEPLLNGNTTMGHHTPMPIGNGVILARPHAKFICVWLQNFRSYQPWPWFYSHYGGEYAYAQSKVLPDCISIEKTSMNQPNTFHADLMFRHHTDWSQSYAMNLWKRQGFVPSRPEEINGLDSTLGEVMRHIYYGNKSLVGPAEVPIAKHGMDMVDTMQRFMP